MNDSKEDIIIKSKPSLKIICLGSIGSIFFGAFAYMVISAILSGNAKVTGVEYETGIIGMWIIYGLFIFFVLYSLKVILLIKTVTLTKKSLIINKPFLLLSKTMPIKNIKKITESPYKINTSYDWTNYNAYDGKQILIDFYTGKSISLNSFEISEYNPIKNSLNELTRAPKNEIEEDLENNTQGIGWLVFACLMTIALVYSVFMKNS